MHAHPLRHSGQLLGLSASAAAEELPVAEAERTRLNGLRLRLVATSLRPRIMDLLHRLETRGYHPLIAEDVWRSPERQRQLHREGRSKMAWSFHCATNPDGTPGSLAVDIVDAGLGWGAGRAFWIALGAAARTEGLNWGGTFGLNAEPALKARLDQALRELDADPSIKLGWDPAHVEAKDLSLSEAWAGARR